MHKNVVDLPGLEPGTFGPRRHSKLSNDEALALSRDCSRLARAWRELGDRRQSAWLAGAAHWLDDEVIGGVDR